MRKSLFASALVLVLAAPAQAKRVDMPAQPATPTCAKLRLTGGPIVPQPPPLSDCCGAARQCARYLSITPIPRGHRYLRT
jgi:hypothetical protein